jgi:hypothetical protein
MGRRKFRFNDPKKTDREIDELTGPVRQMMQTIYKAHSKACVVFAGKIECDYGDDSNFISVYNENGTRVRLISYSMQGYKIQNFIRQNLATEWLEYDKKGMPRSSMILKYRDDDKPEEITTYDGNGVIKTYTLYKYDEAGRALEQLSYHGPKKTLHERYEHIYNEFGKPVSSSRYVKGELEYRTTNTYNEKGHLLEQVSKSTSEEMAEYNSRTVFKPNEYGDSVETTFYKGTGTPKTYYQDYQYDNEGKRIIPPREEEVEEGESEKCEYDVHGNWIKKTTFNNDIAVNILVREINYFDEAEKTFVHPFMLTTEVEETDEMKVKAEELSVEDAKWLSEINVPGTGAENFPAMRYYAMMYKEFPSMISYGYQNIEAVTVHKELVDDMNAEEIHSYRHHGGHHYTVRYTLSFRQYPGYLLQANHINPQNEDEFTVPDNVDASDGLIYTGQFNLLCPSEASGKRDSYFESEILEYICKCSLRKKPDKPVINIIQASSNGFVMSARPVDNNFKIDDLDVNYGAGFNKFHNDLILRFNTSTKGLVLFHGQPGTGKTYYIRHLLRNMVQQNKVVIYMPPNMVDHLVEPGFMTFLSGEVQEFSENNQTCVLLIEDAEPLLAKRQEGVRIQGITNLLNMSDGLLNDMLKLQIICTFNVDLRKLDSALLRPGRLIARKEFKALPELDANLLAQRLKIKHHFKGPATLGEIYAMRRNKDTLIHEVESDKGASTLLDDLL